MTALIVCNKYNMVTNEYHCYCECKECHNQKEPELDDWIKPYIDSINERFSNVGKR